MSLSRHPCIHTFKHEYLWDHKFLSGASLGRGEKAALFFGPDQISTLVSMETDSFLRVIMEIADLEHLKKSPMTKNGRMLWPLLNESLFLQVTTIKAWMSLNFSQIQSLTIELAPLDCLKNLCIILWPLSRSFIFDWIIFILVGNKDSHKSWDGFKFGQIGPGTVEL